MQNVDEAAGRKLPKITFNLDKMKNMQIEITNNNTF